MNNSSDFLNISAPKHRIGGNQQPSTHRINMTPDGRGKARKQEQINQQK